MFQNSQTYTNLGSAQIYVAGVPAVIKSGGNIPGESKGKKFLSAALIAVSLSLSTLQTGFVLNANATGNPISAPISAQESPVPTPSQIPLTSPVVCPQGHVATVINGTVVCIGQSQTQQQQNNNQNVTATGGSTSSSSSSNPITSPEVTPSVKIISPNGGEVFSNGQAMNIEWEASNASNYTLEIVNIDYPQNPGWITSIYDSTQKSFNWTISSLPGNFKIRITNYKGDGTSVSDESDDFFIVNPAQPSNNNNGRGNEQSSSSNNAGGSSNNSGGSSAPSCNNEAPKAPKIISATSAGKNEITLNWEKAEGNVTHYAVSYGFLKGKPLYGNTNIGNVTSFTVKGLSAGVTYYFTVNAVNGCTAGPVSNEIGIKGGGKFINTPAIGFKKAVLGRTLVNTSGKTVQFKNPNSTPVVNIIVSPKPVQIKFEGSNTLNPGLLGKAVSFIQSLFN